MILERTPLQSESQLLSRCKMIEGLSFAQLARLLDILIPDKPVQRKGWTGQAIELALGATSGSKSVPDFFSLGIELKTLPINHLGKPKESTFITTIPLLTVHQQEWKTSQCYAKLKRVLWLPIEGDTTIPFADRRIGRAVLWSPTALQESVLASDWNEIIFMISTGQLDKIDATIGEYLQVRPKAANAKSLCYGFDEAGNKVLTMPRGFYLRSIFTKSVLL